MRQVEFNFTFSKREVKQNPVLTFHVLLLHGVVPVIRVHIRSSGSVDSFQGDLCMLKKGGRVFSEIENIGKHSGPHNILLSAPKNKCTYLERGERVVCILRLMNVRLFAGTYAAFKAAKRDRTRTEIDGKRNLRDFM